MSDHLKDFDFATLSLPSSPNWYLLCPPGKSQARNSREGPVFDVPLARLRGQFFEIVSRTPRTALVADAPAQNRYRFIQKTRLFKFIDEITVEFVPIDPERSSLYIFSRARSGWWDFGVNRRRVRRWVKRLNRQLQ